MKHPQVNPRCAQSVITPDVTFWLAENFFSRLPPASLPKKEGILTAACLEIQFCRQKVQSLKQIARE